MAHEDTATLARQIVDANRYMTLATADGAGNPWATPVWYAHEGYTDFLWVSRPDALHSVNVAGRPALGLVIFDSTAPVGAAQAVYVDARADEVPAMERKSRIETYSRRSEQDGAGPWREVDVSAPSPHRLYRATASRLYVLGSGDRRVAVTLS